MTRPTARRRPAHRPLRKQALLAAASVSLLAACTQELPQNSLAPAGPVAEQQADLYWLVFWIATAVFVLVTIFTAFYVAALLRGRVRALQCARCGRTTSRIHRRCPRCGESLGG